jgi:hypothetical protein
MEVVWNGVKMGRFGFTATGLFTHPLAVAHIIVDLLSKKERRARRRRASSSSSGRRRGGSLGCHCCCPSLPVRRERRPSRPSRPPAKLTSIDAQSGGASSGGAHAAVRTESRKSKMGLEAYREKEAEDQ